MSRTRKQRKRQKLKWSNKRRGVRNEPPQKKAAATTVTVEINPRRRSR